MHLFFVLGPFCATEVQKVSRGFSMSCGWKTFGNWSLTLPSNAIFFSLPQGIVCAQLRLLLGNFGPFKRPSKTRVGCITPNGTLFLHSGEICSWEPAPGNLALDPSSILFLPLIFPPKNDRFSSNKQQARSHTPKKNPSSLQFTSQKVVCADAGSHTAATLLVFFSWCSFSSQKRQHCET